MVPHFFSGKSPDHTPELYMECRNLIVAKYMEYPERRLSVSDCKGLVARMQEDDLARIVRFLDHWGIINYCAAALPNREPWSSISYLREDPNGEVHVPSAALKSIDSLIKFDKPKCRLKAAEVYSSLSCNGDEESDLDCKIRERLSDNRCNYCSRALPVGYYQSQKEVNFNILFFYLLFIFFPFLVVIISLISLLFHRLSFFLHIEYLGDEFVLCLNKTLKTRNLHHLGVMYAHKHMEIFKSCHLLLESTSIES